ncbi:uncharacterized protein LOC144039300 isoform X2 [Vanacampus margaritifer]
MGRERPVMEDADFGTSTCRMPTLEAEEKAKWPLRSSKVEATLRNCDRRIGRGKFLRAQEQEKGALEQVGEGRDSEDNNNNNCNEGGGGRSEASEFLRGTLPTWTTPCQSGGPNADAPGGAEGAHGDDAAEQPGRAGIQNEPPHAELSPSDFGRLDLLSLLDIRRDKRDSAVASVRSEPTANVKEHLYCTVYCIANERHHDVLATSASGLVLHTADDLVKPLRRSSQQGAAAQAQTCRVCLEDKSIAPLPCCRKLVCEECLTLYVTSQVREAKRRIRCPIPECGGMLEGGAVESRLSAPDLLRYRYFLELSQLDAGTKPCPRCALFTTLPPDGPSRRHQRKHKSTLGASAFWKAQHDCVAEAGVENMTWCAGAAGALRRLPLCVVLQVPRPLAPGHQMPRLPQGRQAADDLGWRRGARPAQRPKVPPVQDPHSAHGRMRPHDVHAM